MRTIYLPALDRNVSLKQYIAAVKLAKANPTARFKHGFTCWWSCTGKDVMRQFFEGVQDRINQAVPYVDRR